MHSIYKQSSLPYFSKKPCPKCEKVLSFDVLVCPNCKYNFSSMNFEGPKTKSIDLNALNNQQAAPTTVIPVQQPQQNLMNPAYSTAPQTQAYPTQFIQTQPQMMNRAIYCDTCGNRILGNQRFCGTCGNLNSKKFCELCGQIISTNKQFCPFCGGRQTMVEFSNNQQQGATQVYQTVPSQMPQQSNNPQPINIYLNNQGTNGETTAFTIPNQYNETTQIPVVNNEPTPQVNNPELSTEEIECPVEIINMGRKRFFLIFQLIISLLIAAVATLFPLLTKNSFFSLFISGFKGSLINDAIITGYQCVKYGIDMVKAFVSNWQISDAINVIKSDELRSLVYNSETNSYIFASLPGVSHIINFICGTILHKTDKIELVSLCVSLGAVGLIYLVLAVELVITILSSFFGLFVKRPYKVKAFKAINITLFFGSLMFFTSRFTEPFKNYDCWFIYAFALGFLYWFVAKLVFLRENKTYTAYKEAKKNRDL